MIMTITVRIIVLIFLLIVAVEPFSNSDGSLKRYHKATLSPGNRFHQRWHHDSIFPLHETRSSGDSTTIPSSTSRDEIKNRLLQLIASTPSNAPTTRTLTNQIISVIRQLERECPTPDDRVLQELGGNWELIWTAQDRTSPEWSRGPLSTWINPLENQAYSNNPSGVADALGRANPVLPREIQDRLEKFGIIQDAGVIRSSQAILLDKREVRNVVSFGVAGRRSSLTVTVAFRPNPRDPRRVDVKFQKCRFAISPLDVTIPLGIFGPTGWLRTVYIDDDMRVTRGHKGSVFVLTRPKAKGATLS